MVVLQNESLTVSISAFGAEIQSVRDANQIERIWHGDPAYWASHAPVLFPVAGFLKDNTYTLNGKTYSLPKHGFARDREFVVEHCECGSASFLLAGENGKHPGFPFQYEFRVCYTLAGNTIRVDYQTRNLDDQEFWYSVGAHEAYACPEGIEAYEVEFEKKERLTRGILEGGLLTSQKELVQDECKTLPIRPSLFDNDTQVYTSLVSRSVTMKTHLHQRGVRVEFLDFDYLLLWTKIGAGFLCIEPWGNLPDLIDSNQDITKKPGMVRLLPGEEHTHTHTITFIG